MINGRKNSLKYRTPGLLSVLLLILTSNIYAHYHHSNIFYKTLTAFQDTTRLPVKDTIPVKNDSLTQKTDTFSVKLSKDSIDAPVAYEASDSMVLDVPNKKIILYSKGKVTYKDLVLTADSIALDQPSNMIEATYRKDTSGNIIGRPEMTQGETKMQADIIRYNTKTQKGITSNTYTSQGEMFVNMRQSKKVSENEYYGLHGVMTTCNLDTPHFAFVTNKMKLINKKMAVTGPVHPEFEGVPVPIYIPFGIFPLAQGRHSGLLPPQFTSSEQFGLGLEGLGYYKVLNDYFDVTLRTNLYSYGGWSAFITPTYRKRYRYSGSFNLAYQHTKILTDDPKNEFSTSRTFNITWSHSVDSRARPGTSFSASVNAGSTKFNRLVPNNNTLNYTNQLNSSITYSKNWEGKYNLTVSANHNQNNNTGIINLSLPNLSFTANTFYPFQKQEFVGTPKWYEKLGIGLNSTVSNRLSFYDSAFSVRRILDTIQWGAQHNIPIQLSLPPVLGIFQVAPGISYQERWYSQHLIRSWNSSLKKVDTTIQKGFFTSRDVSFSLGLSTALFGMFNRFGKNSNIQAIRHVVRPSLSMSYKPDMASKDYYYTQIDTTGRNYRFSYYDGAVYGPFSPGTFGGLSFGIDNNLEAKLRNKTDSTAEPKKIRLIDGFGINSSYNFMVDSFKLAPFNLYARSTLFEKINITAGAVVDPYQVDSTGYRVDRYMWNGKKFSLGRITSGNVAVSANFQSKKKKDDDKKKEPPPGQEDQIPATMEDQMAQMEYVRQNPAEFVDFNVPWSLNLSYSLNFYRQFKPDYSGFETIINSNFNWGGDFSLTEKWKFGMNGFYDFKTSKVQSLTMFITREMHCWQLSINVTPVGLYRSFNITINPKAGILRDLRINRVRYFSGN